jgi:CBS domain-containing protein
MQISELLTSKGTAIFTVRPDVEVRDVIEELSRRNIGAVVVSADGTSIDGIASERDVVRALDRHGAGILERPVREIMSSDVQVCSPKDTVDSLMSTMTNHRIRHLPVVEHGALVGIVSIGDVVKSRLGELEEDRDALVNYIGAR